MRTRYDAEHALQIRVVRHLQAQGLDAWSEYSLPDRGGRVDIVVFDSDRLIELIEVKLGSALAGIGQLLGYRHALHDPSVKLTLLVPENLRSPHLEAVCEEVGIRLWRFPFFDLNARYPRTDDQEYTTHYRPVGRTV